MNGKENKVPDGTAGSIPETAQGQAGSQAPGQKSQAIASPNASESSAKAAIDYAVELASRDAQIAERDARIAELEDRASGADALGKLNESLKAENEQLRNQMASDRVDFALQLVGCRNVKATRAVLDDYDGDVEALKSAEPWLFAAHAEAIGATGLPNAGAASDDGKDARRWRKLAGLSPKKDD